MGALALMGLMITLAGVWRGSQGTTARAGSTCVTGTPARTLPLVKTEMGFIFVTVHQDSQDRTVTR